MRLTRGQLKILITEALDEVDIHRQLQIDNLIELAYSDLEHDPELDSVLFLASTLEPPVTRVDLRRAVSRKIDAIPHDDRIYVGNEDSVRSDKAAEFDKLRTVYEYLARLHSLYE